jgi:hypothetical protein
MQSAVRLDDLEAGPQIQVKGIAKHDLRARPHELLRRHRLDRPVGAHRHERGGLDRAARELEAPAARHTVAGEQGESHASAPGAGVANMASP